MKKLQIITDSTCDIPKQMKEEAEIMTLPLHVRMGNTDLLDGIDIRPDDICAYAEQTKKTPQTSAPSLADAESLIKEALHRAETVLCLGISSEMSASCQVMKIAAEASGFPERVHVIDSRNLSSGLGLLVLVAAECAERGIDAEEAEREILPLISRVRTSFIVSNMEYLRRGGRCNTITALCGTALKICPSIRVKDGEMTVAKKYRGTVESAAAKYTEDLLPDIREADPGTVFVTNSGQCGKAEDTIINILEQTVPKERIHTVRAGSVISAHCGPGTIGIIFMEKGQN